MKSSAIMLVLALLPTAALAQIQPGPNISPNGTPFLYSPRAGYLGPPVAVHRWPPFPFLYRSTGAPSIPVLDGPYARPAPPMAYAPAPPVVVPLLPPPPEAPCIVDPYDVGLAPFLNVRTSPNGWIVGQLANGTPVFPTGEAFGNWIVIAAPIPGWVFRPYLACLPPPPPDTALPGAPPVRGFAPPAVQARPVLPPAPAPRLPGQRRPPPCPDGCPRD